MPKKAKKPRTVEAEVVPAVSTLIQVADAANVTHVLLTALIDVLLDADPAIKDRLLFNLRVFATMSSLPPQVQRAYARAIDLLEALPARPNP